MNMELQGVGVALVTPFNKDLSIDFNGLARLLNHLEEVADYLVVMGTTGESATLTESEKKQILAFVIENTSLPIVYGIGGNNTNQVIEILKNTQFEGITAILSVSPSYNKPPQRGIVEHYKLIAKHSPVPVIMYNVPSRTGSNMLPSTTIELSSVENIIGLKEANTELDQYQSIASGIKETFMLISGDDMNYLNILAVGGNGLISVLANAFPIPFKKATQLFKSGETVKANKMLLSLHPINSFMYKEGNPVGIKSALAALGICGPWVRLPLVEASEQLAQQIKLEVQKVI